MRFLLRLVNPKGELFASTFTYAANAVIRLVSSLILTRLLSPAVYGIFSILLTFLFTIELLSDVGVTGLLIRHPRGHEARFVHTLWTVRLLRSIVNFGLLFFGAPLIAYFYRLPVLTEAFRALSFWFLLTGAESMSFILLQRDRKARISNYTELAASLVSTVFVIGSATVLRNHFALIYGSLLQRALLMIASHFLYRDIGVGFAFDREALHDQFKFARFVLPSSLLSLVIQQYDKLALVKLSGLATTGLYGVAGNIMGPTSGIITHNARVVLYARCADYFRSDPRSAASRYYAENRRLLLVGALLPALVAGFSHSIISILYDTRYAMAGDILMILGLGGIIAAFQNASEVLLVASGVNHIVLTANVVRVLTVIPAALLGYYFFGFYGFLWFGLAGLLPTSAYYFWEQRRRGLLQPAGEMAVLGSALLAFLLCLAASHLLLMLIPAGWLHLGLKRHSTAGGH